MATMINALADVLSGGTTMWRVSTVNNRRNHYGNRNVRYTRGHRTLLSAMSDARDLRNMGMTVRIEKVRM